MTETRHRGLVEGALLLAVWLLLAIVTAFTPIGLASALLLPVPVVVLVVRQGVGPALLLASLSFFAPLLVGVDLVRTVVMALFGSISGLALGIGYRRGLGPTIVFALGLGGNILAVFLLMNLLSLFFNVNVVVEFLAFLQRVSTMVVEFLESIRQLPTESVQQFIENWPLLAEGAVLLIPGVVLIAMTAATFVLQNISQMVLLRLGTPVAPFPPFVKWRFGDWYLWLFVFSLFLSFVAGRWVPAFWIIGYNIFSPLFYGLAIQGLAVAYWWLRFIPSKAARIFPLFAVVFPFVFMLFSLVGLADFLFNFRRL